MRWIGPITALALTAGCAQILGVDEEWTQPEEGAGPSTSSAASLASTSGAGAQGPGGAGGGLGAGGAECPSAEEMQEDAKNCGSCGHDCLGGACEGGVCKPVLIYDKEPLPSSGTIFLCTLVVDESHVYLAVAPSSGGVGTGVIVRLKKDGSDPDGVLALATGELNPFGLALDDDPKGNLYFANASANPANLVAVRKSGGEPSILSGSIAPWLFLAYRSGKLFVTTTTGPLQEFDLSVGAPKPFAEGATADDVEVDEKYVFWIDRLYGEIRRKSSGLAKPQTVAPLASGQGRLALHGDALYFASNRVAGSEEPMAKIGSVPKAGGIVRTLREEPVDVWSLAADARHVYWTTGSETANTGVFRMPKDGSGDSGLEQLALAGASRPVVTLDEGAAYWCTFEGHVVSVFRLAK